MTPVAAPIAYTVRQSDRARHVRLRVTEAAGLEVVVPRGFDVRLLPEMLEPRRAWAEHALTRMAARRAERGPCEPPRALELRALGETWAVEYRLTSASRTCARVHAGRLLVVSGPADDDARRAALRRWLCAHVREPFDARARSLAAAIGSEPAAVRVRWQRSRWGSCSASGDLSLNGKLGFLPQALADHVLLHELTHLEVFDHSPAFHALLASRDEHAHHNAQALREAWRYVPVWLDVPFTDSDGPSPAS